MSESMGRVRFRAEFSAALEKFEKAIKPQAKVLHRYDVKVAGRPDVVWEMVAEFTTLDEVMAFNTLKDELAGDGRFLEIVEEQRPRTVPKRGANQPAASSTAAERGGADSRTPTASAFA